jgi:hypothetical protein
MNPYFPVTSFVASTFNNRLKLGTRPAETEGDAEACCRGWEHSRALGVGARTLLN